MTTPFKLKNKKDFNFGNKKFDYSKRFDYSKKKEKTYPKSYTKEDIKFLKEQREDVVREEDKS